MYKFSAGRLLLLSSEFYVANGKGARLRQRQQTLIFTLKDVIIINELLLNKYISDNDIDSIVLLVQKSDKPAEYLNRLIDFLQKTDNSDFRNTIAIALADLQYQDAVPVLVKLIHKYHNTDNYASLIYALSLLNCEQYICELVYLIYHGNFEARHNMYNIIADNIEKMSLQNRNMMIQEINRYIEDCEDKKSLLIDTIEILKA